MPLLVNAGLIGNARDHTGEYEVRAQGRIFWSIGDEKLLIEGERRFVGEDAEALKFVSRERLAEFFHVRVVPLLSRGKIYPFNVKHRIYSWASTCISEFEFSIRGYTSPSKPLELLTDGGSLNTDPRSICDTQLLLGKIGGTLGSLSCTLGSNSLLPGMFSEFISPSQASIEVMKLNLKLIGGFGGIRSNLPQGFVGCFPVFMVHPSLIPRGSSSNSCQEDDSNGQISITSSEIVSRYRRVNLTLLVGIVGFITLLLFLPRLVGSPLALGGEDNGIPWRWVSLVVGWITIAQVFVFLIMKGLWG